MLFRDLVDRYQISNIAALKFFLFGLKQGRIITYDSYDSFKIEGIVCELVPVIEFLNY